MTRWSVRRHARTAGARIPVKSAGGRCRISCPRETGRLGESPLPYGEQVAETVLDVWEKMASDIFCGTQRTVGSRERQQQALMTKYRNDPRPHHWW